MRSSSLPYIAGLTGVFALWMQPVSAESAPGPSDEQRIAFNRDVRPLLADRCFTCHGPDGNQRKVKLRLDSYRGDTATLPSANLGEDSVRGLRAVAVPGKRAESELFRRISATDPAQRMPPPGASKPLSPAEIELVGRWIDQGAQWQPHWSLMPPKRAELPEVSDARWATNPIDLFIVRRLELAGVRPSPEADRRTLFRRVHFDLLGLPPEPEQVDAFVNDSRPDAYERLVERLLASPYYGERMAIYWLDLVRYADTVGYHGDQERSITPYRDYVIDAFNGNLPFDQFTVEQLAGDLLPEATLRQRVAAGYNMLGMTTIEGGAQPKEYLAKYASDRVRTTSAVWMAVTLGCAECHNHKFDPYSTEDFYRFAAFFADIQQEGVANPEANLAVPEPWEAERLAEIETEIDRVKQQLAATGGGSRESLEGCLADLQKQQEALLGSVRRTITPVSGPPRVTRVLPRGDWLNESGEVVLPDVPASMRPIQGATDRLTRLDLARWLVSRDHPQTARVFVNRLWKMFYGAGLSRVLDDLGSRGGWPTHPELLDWLAVEFIESGWDVKHMVRLMVTSSAYRQSSLLREDLQRSDPQNRLLARQSRLRIEGELVRDNALAISGLLVRRIGGERARPYQPAGYYAYLNFPKRVYEPSTGEQQYRRGVYTHWQRTFLHPMLLAFDAPTREECTAQRPVSNTPLAALALLNDPTFVEAARAFAERIVREGGSGTGDRVNWAWRQALSRDATEQERQVLCELLEKHRAEYRNDPEAAEQLLRTGLKVSPQDVDAVELAAWTSVARTILNLNEAITRN